MFSLAGAQRALPAASYLVRSWPPLFPTSSAGEAAPSSPSSSSHFPLLASPVSVCSVEAPEEIGRDGIRSKCFLALRASFDSSGIGGRFYLHLRYIRVCGSSGRSLLQAQTSCPIDFENMNYTIITSKCKGPQYAANICCTAVKEFACPYADQLNDATNDCYNHVQLHKPLWEVPSRPFRQ